MEDMEVIIETPKGSPVKYDYDPERHDFRLKKALPAGMVFPYDFGFIPGTKGEDGDPLDIILISEFNTFPGCRLECRLIGGLQARQSASKDKKKKIRNDRFLVIPAASVVFKNINSLKQLPEKLLDGLEAFFVQYNRMEGKSFEVQRRMQAGKALKLIKTATT